jgi:redox-sensitive bicupin YhaK (pirin superfamily)
MKRQVEALLEGVLTKDGTGIRVRRMIGNPKVCRLDPFLLFDWFELDQEDDYDGVYPEHPHRGFDTLIYLTRGKMRHTDFLGNDCVLAKGDFTWMSAGKGIVHSETPLSKDEPAAGLHIWINRHSADKTADPDYAHLVKNTIPVTKAPRIEIRVLSGELPDGSRWPKGSPDSSPVLLDISQQHSATFVRSMQTEDSALIYVIEGEIRIEDELVERGKLAALSSGNRVQIYTGDSEARYLFCSAQPLNEPVVRTGPFVMNTREELLHAFRDYQEGWFSEPK